jgi:hypothetical protein
MTIPAQPDKPARQPSDKLKRLLAHATPKATLNKSTAPGARKRGLEALYSDAQAMSTIG